MLADLEGFCLENNAEITIPNSFKYCFMDNNLG